MGKRPVAADLIRALSCQSCAPWSGPSCHIRGRGQSTRRTSYVGASREHTFTLGSAPRSRRQCNNVAPTSYKGLHRLLAWQLHAHSPRCLGMLVSREQTVRFRGPKPVKPDQRELLRATRAQLCLGCLVRLRVSPPNRTGCCTKRGGVRFSKGTRALSLTLSRSEDM